MLDSNSIAKDETKLIGLDPVLGSVIKRNGPIKLAVRDGYFLSLCRTIIGQQVSVAAASSIFNKFNEATKLDPVFISGLDDETMRSFGLSRQKASYIRDLALHFADNPTIYNHLDKLSDDEVIKELTAVKGIGVWSAQMFLMFTLSRPDVFAPDDIGLQRAIKNIYAVPEPLKKQELINFASKWQPYRTIACLHLWKSLNNSPE